MARGLLAMTLVVAVLGACVSSASAVIVELENGTTLSYQPAPGARANGVVSPLPFDKAFENLDYGGGPVMTSNTNYTFYWHPPSASAYPATFKSGVNTYFKDLEHDSGGHENVESVATQYNNAAGEFVKYESKFGGEIIDEHAYPANGCTRAPICLTDEQIRAELKRYISEHKLPTDLKHEYFVLPPEGVESCFEAGAGYTCSANVTELAYQAYCAYHGNIPLAGGSEIIYANDPFVNKKNCDESEHHINGPSDSALFGGMSHERNESVTDPEPNNAWTNWAESETFGQENGDKCRNVGESTEFGTPLGEVPVGGKKLKYNQEINGHKYWYQQEWSNKGHQCLQRLTFKESEAPTATFTSATVSGDEVKFNAAGSTTGTHVRYSWQFNDYSGHHENYTQETEALTLNRAFPATGVYTVALTVYKEDGTSKGVAKQVFVGKPQEIKFTSTAPVGATVGGPTYKVTATGGSSGNAVTFAIDGASSAVCSISGGATVSFKEAGTCTIDANQADNSAYAPAPEAKQGFAVGKGSQTIGFTSSEPVSAKVGGATYNVTATGGASGKAVTFAIDGTSSSVCSISGGSTVSFEEVGTCKIDAKQEGNTNYEPAPLKQQSFSVSKGSQSITFTSAPSGPVVGGATYNVTATGGASGKAVTFAIDGTSSSVCSISGGSTVSFEEVGTCKIDAKQEGNTNYEAAPMVQQAVAVKMSQSITFTSTAPGSASVGGASYTVSATSSSGLTVASAIDGTSGSVCSISGSTVSFIGAGTCTIDANQGGDANYNAASQAQQSFSVAPAPALTATLTPTLISAPAPDSNFSAVGASFNANTGVITFKESVGDPGTFSWLLTFRNGKFGVFAASVTKCKKGQLKRNGRCRPGSIVFGKGSQAVAAAGTVTFAVKPTPSGYKALKNALREGRGLAVTATLSFQSSLGGSRVSHTQSLTIRLKKH